MELRKLTDRIWYGMYEKERDRPCLGYIKGDHWSLAVDAGHSAEHVQEFYDALQKEGLPLPALTAITHWHWDHAFGMHCISGLSVANARTNHHLMEFEQQVRTEGTQVYFELDPSIPKEYASGQPVVIVPADIEFQDTLQLDPGGVHILLSTSISPHTDDTTLVYVLEEKVLFVGDSICGAFPTWEIDPEKMWALIHKIRTFDADFIVSGHMEAIRKDELLDELVEEIRVGTGEAAELASADLVLAKKELEEKGCTCVLRKGDDVCLSYDHGVKPLLQWIGEGKDFTGYVAADQVVGKAAALLYACLGVHELYGQVISEPAILALEEHHIAYTYGECVPYIVNRKKDGLCPMEQTVLSITEPEKAVEALRNKVADMMKK